MRAHGPWVIHESSQPFDSEFVQLYEDRVTRPDGSAGSYATVTLKPGVAVLALTAEGRVHLTRQFRFAIGRDSVEVVSGGLEHGEEPLQAAKRELREEVGLIADTWTDLGAIDLDTSIVRCQVHLFLAEGLRGTRVDPDPSEDIRRITVTFEAAVEMALNGDITHAASSVLILKAGRRRSAQDVAR